MLTLTCPKLRVDIVSVRLLCAGEMLTNMQHFDWPPSESCSTWVSFELRYGTCGLLLASAGRKRGTIQTAPTAAKKKKRKKTIKSHACRHGNGVAVSVRV